MGRENVLDPENATIDQIKGTLKAIKMGYKKIAVTIVAAEDAKKLREMENDDIKIFIFAAHVSEISKNDAKTIFDNSDVVTGCASKYIREIGDEKDYLKAGASIPIYGVTESGKRFLKMRIDKIGGLKEKKNPKIPEPLI